jgi:hypothetical protein
MRAAAREDLQLFVRLLRRDHQGARRCLRQRQAPLAALVDTAAGHGLAVMLLRALDDSPLRDGFDAAQLARLEASRRRQSARGERLLEVLDRLATRLEAEGQPFLLLKGPYLAERYYGDVEAREWVDLDLLVPRADRARVFRLLGEEGFAPKSRTLLGAAVTCYFVHGFDFVARGAGDTVAAAAAPAPPPAQVDLHWCLSRHPSLRLDEPALWRRRQWHRLRERRYAVLAPEDEVLFAAVSLLRDLERGRPKLKNVLDLLKILASTDAELDWDEILARRRREGIVGPVVNVAGLCLDVGEAHDLAPRLSATLARRSHRRVRARPTDTPLVFAPTRYNLGNRLWCAQAYDSTLLRWLLWWGVSLPFRMAVHRTRPPAAPRPGLGAQP